MKIAFVLSTCARSGPFIVAANIINTLSKSVGEIDIYYVRDRTPVVEINGKKIKVELRGKTDFSSYDIVHSHGFLGDIHAFVNRKTIRGKWVTTLHQKIKPVYSLDYNWFVGTMMELVWLRIVSRTNAIVTLTRDMADYYTSGWRLSKKVNVVYVHNGITPVTDSAFIPNEDELVRISELKKRYTILGISAGVTYLKGIDRVIKALASPAGARYGLIVVGDGPEKQKLIDSANSLGVGARVLFLGFKTNPIDYFKYFDVYMMASRSEGFGLCVIEAASQMVPVACNDLNVFHELFTDEEVVRFDLSDLSSMTRAIETALANKLPLTGKLYEKYTQRYSAEAMADGYLHLYKSL